MNVLYISGKGGWGCGRNGSPNCGGHAALEWSLSVYNHVILNTSWELEMRVGKVYSCKLSLFFQWLAVLCSLRPSFQSARGYRCTAPWLLSVSVWRWSAHARPPRNVSLEDSLPLIQWPGAWISESSALPDLPPALPDSCKPVSGIGITRVFCLLEYKMNHPLHRPAGPVIW